MERNIKRAIICGCMAILGGCTATTKDTHHLENVAIQDLEAGVAGISSDAKQRFIWAPRKEGSQIICAEPSPDALSQLASAASLQAQLKTTKVEGDVALETSFSEVAKNIGKRTATIQLLRDGLYRACEAYANQAIDEFGYSLILNGIDNVMVKLVALEALGEGQPAPDDTEGKNKIQTAAEKESETKLAQTQLETAQLNLSNREREAAEALKAFESTNAEVAGIKATIAAVESQIDAESTKGDTKDQKKIDSLEQQKIGLTGNLASAEHRKTTTQNRSEAAATAFDDAKKKYDTAVTNAKNAATAAEEAKALAETVTKNLMPGAVNAIRAIVEHSSARSTAIGACILFLAQNAKITDLQAPSTPAIAKFCGAVLGKID